MLKSDASKIAYPSEWMRLVYVLIAILLTIAFAVAISLSILAGTAFSSEQVPFDLGGLAGGFIAVGAAWLAVRWEAASQDARNSSAARAAQESAIKNVRTMCGVAIVKVTPLTKSLFDVVHEATAHGLLKLDISVDAMKRGWLAQASEPVPFGYVDALPAPYPFFFVDRFRAFSTHMNAIADPPNYGAAQPLPPDLRRYGMMIGLQQAYEVIRDILKTTDELVATLKLSVDDLSAKQRDKIDDVLKKLALLIETT